MAWDKGDGVIGCAVVATTIVANGLVLAGSIWLVVTILRWMEVL